jgi:hypothetical protein
MTPSFDVLSGAAPSQALELAPTTLPTEQERAPGTSFLARTGSFLILFGLAAGLLTVGWQGYLVVTDAFVAPMILTPDNDLVLAVRQRVLELEDQKALAVASLEGITADTAAIEVNEKELADVSEVFFASLRWTGVNTRRQTSADSVDLSTLGQQRSILETIKSQQEKSTADAQTNLNAGLITREEYERDLQALHQAALNLLENQRVTALADAALSQAASSGPHQPGHGGALMPDVATRYAQMAEVRLDLARVQSEKRAKLAEKRALEQKISQTDALLKELKSRPLYRAVDKSLYAAFVPYSQLDRVATGKFVYRCVAGLFACTRVGIVRDLVPGEMSMPDPWGTPNRGQLILLDLDDASGAKERVLRVRRSEEILPPAI